MEPPEEGLSVGEPTTEERIKLHQSAAGRVGGLSRSDAKRKSSAENLKRARINRWKGREAAAMNATAALLAGVVNVQKEGAPERSVSRDSSTAIAIGGPIRSSPSGDQSDSRDGQPQDGEYRDGGHQGSCNDDVRPLSNGGGEG